MSLILFLAGVANCQTGSFLRDRFSNVSDQLLTEYQIAKIDYQLGFDRLRLPQVEQVRDDFKRLQEDHKKSGDLNWLQTHMERPSQEDRQMVSALTALIPAIKPHDMFFVGSSELIRRIVDVGYGPAEARALTVPGADGPKRIMIIDMRRSAIKKWAHGIHEGIHFSHRLTEDSTDKLLAALAQDLGAVADKRDIISFMLWIEEGYTQWLTLKALETLSAPSQGDKLDAARQSFQAAMSRAASAELAEFEKDNRRTYAPRVSFVRTLAGCGALEAVAEFSERENFRPLISFLGGSRNVTMLGAAMRQLEMEEVLGDAAKTETYRQMVSLVCSARSHEIAATPTW